MLQVPAAFDVLDEIDSTNEEARRRFDRGDPGPGVVSALSQTGGRGRRGRRWESPKGGLYFTYYGLTDAPPSELALLGFVASLAVCDVVERLGQGDAQVKWPNDVLLQGGKIAGVLLESTTVGPDGCWFALGIGINLGAAPDGVSQAVAALNALMPPQEAAALLMERLLTWGHLLETQGFAPVRAAWLPRAHGLGRPATALRGSEPVTGIFADLDADGALLLDTEAGRVRITAGEVYFPNNP